MHEFHWVETINIEGLEILQDWWWQNASSPIDYSQSSLYGRPRLFNVFFWYTVHTLDLYKHSLTTNTHNEYGLTRNSGCGLLFIELDSLSPVQTPTHVPGMLALGIELTSALCWTHVIFTCDAGVLLNFHHALIFIVGLVGEILSIACMTYIVHVLISFFQFDFQYTFYEHFIP